MAKTKEDIENELWNFLDEMLEGYHQNGAIKDVTLSEDQKTCTIVMSVEEYQGSYCFQGP